MSEPRDAPDDLEAITARTPASQASTAEDDTSTKRSAPIAEDDTSTKRSAPIAEDDTATRRSAPIAEDDSATKRSAPAAAPPESWDDAATLQGAAAAGASAKPKSVPSSNSNSNSSSRSSAGAPVDGDLPDAPVSFEQPDRYKLERDQGTGGQGVVAVVRDAVIGREVALKTLHTGRGLGGDSVTARFLREARITGQLQHPSIVPVHELGRRADGSLYYTQKLVRGRTLRAALGECKSLPERLRLLPHFVDICQAVAYAHGRGVVHRDLKPENVMVGEFGETVVLDWGLAKVLGKNDSAADARPSSSGVTSSSPHKDRSPNFPDVDSGETREGEIFGTAQYMAPEQAQGRLSEIDQLSDIWTLGAMLFELLCGHAPFVKPGEKLELRKVAAGVTPKVFSIEPNAPPELAAVAERALKKDRALRYQSAAALSEEIDAWLHGDRVSVYEYSLWELVKKLATKHPIPTAASLLAVLILLVSTVAIARSHKNAITALSETLAIQAASAELDQRWDLAAAWYAAARAQEERVDARLGEAFADSLAARPKLRLKLHGAPALALSWMSETRLAGSSFDGELGLWDAQSGDRLVQSKAHRGPIWALASSGNELASGGADGRVRFWNAELESDGELPADQFSTPAAAPRLEKAHLIDRTGDEGGEGQATGGIAALVFSADGKLLATSSLEQGVDLWDAGARKLLLHLSGVDTIFALDLSPDGKRLVTGGMDGVVRVFELVTSQVTPPITPRVTSARELFHLDAHTGRVRAIAFSPDGSTVASGGQDQRLILWKPGSAEAPRHLDGHQRAVTAVRFSPDGNAVATSSRDGLWILWDAATARPLSRMDADERASNSLAFSPDGRSLAAAYQDEVLRVWELPRERHVVGLAGHADQVRAVAFSPSGLELASASSDGTARIWNRKSGRERLTIAAGAKLRAVAFSRDGTELVTAGDGDSIELWDAATGRSRLHFASNSDGTGAVLFSPHAELLASGGRTGALKLWDPASGKLLKEAATAHPAIESLAFNPQGDLLATSGNDGHVRVWEIPSLNLRVDLRAHGEAGRGVAFSPDGKFLASGGSDRRLVIYETKTWDRVRELRGHRGRVQGVTYSPDGQWLATSCSDRTVRIFSAQTGELLWSIARHEGAVVDIAWSPDSQVLASASADKTLELLRFDGIAELPKASEAQSTVFRNFWLRFVGQRIEPLPPDQRPPSP